MTTATKAKPKKKRAPRQKREVLSKVLDIDSMARVHGMSGIYTTRTINSGQMILVTRFMTDESKPIAKHRIESLGDKMIWSENGVIKITEAFDNLQKHCKNKKTPDELTTEQLEFMMGIICPGYDPEKFKFYHAVKIIGWYNEIITKINEFLKANPKTEKK